MSRLAGKLIALGIQHAVKPLQLVFKFTAGKNSKFKALCKGIGQQVNYLDSVVSRSKLGELKEKEAIELGAGILSECSLVSIALSLILYQTSKSKKKELIRQEGVEDDIKMLQLEIDDLRTQLRNQTILLNDFVVPYGTKPNILIVDDFGKPQVGR